jgi:hypothetical protein
MSILCQLNFTYPEATASPGLELDAKTEYAAFALLDIPIKLYNGLLLWEW